MSKKPVLISIFVILVLGFVFWYKFIRTVHNLEYQDLGVKDPFEATARATGGQVMRFDKKNMGPEQIAQMTALANQALKESDYAILARAEGVSGHRATEFDFQVDSSMSELSVVVSGLKTKPEFELIGPSKMPVSASSVLSSDQSATQVFQNPSPGSWRLRVLKSDNISIYVRAKTEIDIDRVNVVKVGGRPGHEGFFNSDEPLKSGSKETILVELGKVAGLPSSAQIEIISIDGRSLDKIESKSNGASGLLGEIKIPKESFRVLVSWKNEAGQSFRRLDKKTFELNQIKLLAFKYQREESQDSFICKTASYLGTYIDSASDAMLTLICVNRDSGLSSELSFHLPLESDLKLKTFRLASPDYVKMNLQDCELASQSFSALPKVIERPDGKKVEFKFSCQQGAQGLQGVVGVKVTQP